jgi:uncharacterized protein (TIRG00374 family)
MRVVVGSLIGLVALWLAFRGESLDALAGAIGQADSWWTIAALVSIAVSLGCVTLRWRVLFGRPQAGAPKPGLLFNALVLGQAVNIALPIRVGELVRVLMVYRKGGQTLERTFVTVVAERLMDTGVFALAAAWLALQVTFPPSLAGPMRAVTIAGMIAAALGVMALLGGARVAALLRNRVETRARGGLARFAGRSATVVGEVARLRDPRTLIAAAGLSVLILVLSASTNYLLFRAFHLPLPPVAALLVLMVLQVGSAPVSTPGNLGVFQYLTVLALSVYAVDHTAAAAYSVVLYLIAYGPKLVIGAWSLVQVTRDASLGPEVLAMMRGRR